MSSGDKKNKISDNSYDSEDRDNSSDLKQNDLGNNKNLFKSIEKFQKESAINLEPLLLQFDTLNESLSPMRELQDAINKSVIFSLSDVINSYFNNHFLKMDQCNLLNLSMINADLFESFRRITESYKFDEVSRIYSPIQEMLKGISLNPLAGVLKKLLGFDFSKYINQFKDIVIRECYDAKWFPHALWVKEYELLINFCDLIDTTKKSKNRIKKMDQIIFAHFSKDRSESLKKEWRRYGIPKHKMRMMHQAVQAYHRKEYALTVVMLSTLWEGIIYDKADDSSRKNGKRTKKNFQKLVSQSEYNEMVQSFFDEYIMYECRSEDDVKEDVPGRNSSAHSYYRKYPSRKAALNAIIFTDFLLRIPNLR